jgi:hypothetical protein
VSGRPPGPARRAALLRGIGAAAALLGGAGCTIDPVGNYLGGIGDPVRGAALYAPSTIGDTSRWAGRPEQAALAAEQVEFLASEMRSNPRYAPEVNPAVTQQLDRARAEMRGYLGIAPDARPELVIPALRRAAEALADGSRARAEAALSLPAFTAGPVETLARLSAMPRLPQTAAAAGMVSSEIGRLDRIGRR